MDQQTRYNAAAITRVHTGDVTEVKVMDDILQALPRMMRADRRVRQVFLDQAAASMALLIRDEADAVRQQRAIVVEGHLRGLRAQVGLQAEQTEMDCRRDLLRAQAAHLLQLINDARAMSLALDGDEAQALIADLYTDAIEQARSSFRSHVGSRR